MRLCQHPRQNAELGQCPSLSDIIHYPSGACAGPTCGVIVFVDNSTSMATHGRNAELRIAGAQDDGREFVAAGRLFTTN